MMKHKDMQLTHEPTSLSVGTAIIRLWGLPSGCGDCHQAVGTAIRLWGLLSGCGDSNCVQICAYAISQGLRQQPFRSTATVADAASDTVPQTSMLTIPSSVCDR